LDQHWGAPASIEKKLQNKKNNRVDDIKNSVGRREVRRGKKGCDQRGVEAKGTPQLNKGQRRTFKDSLPRLKKVEVGGGGPRFKSAGKREVRKSRNIPSHLYHWGVSERGETKELNVKKDCATARKTKAERFKGGVGKKLRGPGGSTCGGERKMWERVRKGISELEAK